MNKESVNTEFGTVLSNALNTQKVDINLFVWKERDGKEVRLMDMSEQALQKAYIHATDMLYNSNRYTPGKYNVKKNIRKLIANCNAELLKRYLMHECNIDVLKNPLQLIQYVRDFKKANNLEDTDSVEMLFDHLPKEFVSVTLDDLISACLDQLEVVNRKMLSDGFIVSRGIWLTEDEKEDLTEFDENGQIRPWLDVIKERLLLNDVKLRVDPKGFNYKEFRALIHLGPISKISSLPTDTLVLLRDKVFILLDSDIDYHIAKWETLKANIEKVANYKGIKLVQKNYSDEN